FCVPRLTRCGPEPLERWTRATLAREMSRCAAGRLTHEAQGARAPSFDTRVSFAVVLSIALAVALVFGQTLGFDFVSTDDAEYVTDNAVVREGLTRHGLLWALSSGHAANWHPVTWLSHMLDVELFGLDPRAHHATNVLLHAVNSVLLFGFLVAMTGRRWPSAFVAGVFAVHPVHVESVVWIAERKDLLSALFWLLACWAYVRYARGERFAWLASTYGLTALGLMAKPMVVTLPFVLLLIDYWPLGRWPSGAVGAPVRSRGPRSVWRLVGEKMPLFAMAAIAGVITWRVQERGDAMLMTRDIDLGSRLANAIVSYVRYLGKAFWPAELRFPYAHPYLAGGTPWQAWQIAGALLVLVGITVLAIRLRRYGYGLFGWLWFAGTLVPVIGLVQVGYQAMADRYLYLPLIGLSVAATWGALELGRKWVASERLRQRLSTGVALGILLSCGALSWRQAQHWSDSVTLYTHALESSREPHFEYMLRTWLGTALAREGRVEQALAHFRVAARLKPDFARAQRNLGAALAELGENSAAREALERAVRLAPADAEAQQRLGRVLRSLGDLPRAERHLQRAVKLDDTSGPYRYHLAIVLADRGARRQAIDELRVAIDLQPDLAEAHLTLAALLADAGEFEPALRHAKQCQRLGGKVPVGFIEALESDRARAASGSSRPPRGTMP
ncbi:MAG: tetratricopeptide repeat protein, partial [Acidobacteriota bacterium]